MHPTHRRRTARFAPFSGFIICLLLAVPAWAQLERLEIVERQPLEEGHSFGLAGPYEMLTGKAYFAVDPQHPANVAVVDLDKAPRGADGRVRFASDFMIVRPVDLGRGNGSLILDVANRGNPISFLFNFPDYTFRDPQSLGPSGDGFLMHQGFTLAAVGWQSDFPTGPGTLRREPVIARGTGGAPLTGLVRAEDIFGEDVPVFELGHWKHRPYPVADPDDPRNVLTVRQQMDGPRQVIPREQWRFGRLEGKEVVPADDAIVLDGGFEKGKIYELVYVGRDPDIVGLGMVALRDFAAYLRDAEASPVAVDRVLAVGASQTGRLLRHFLYQGFNAGHALDGVFALVAGAGRGSFNHRFGQPSRASTAFMGFGYPTELFPFAGSEQREEERRDSLYRAAGDGELPKVFQVNSGHEYWGRGASLLHTTADGGADLPPPENERIYTIVSTQHSPGSFPPSRENAFPYSVWRFRYPENPANYQWSMRALIVALDAWVRDGSEPPPSRYPNLEDGTLTRLDGYRFPALPEVETPSHLYVPRAFDYGPRFATAGIIDHEPPQTGKAYGVLVPQADADGNERGGIRMPEIAVPLATYTGWNYRSEDIGAPDQLSDLKGAFFPFTPTAAARKASGDPRPAIAERYPSREAYLGRYTDAARALVEEGFLLAEDLPSVLDYADVLWRALSSEE